MTHPAPWTCPTCDAGVATDFCPGCGEGPVPARDLTVRGIAEKVLHAFTSIDAHVARTAWMLLKRPGALTRAWASGVRKQYVAPFQLFLLGNVIFFALQWLTAENVFSSTLASHLHQQDWSALAQSMVAQRLAESGLSLQQYAPVFDGEVVVNAKSLIVLMAAAFALLLPIVFVRERRPFMVHIVFALHLYTFLLLLFCAALLVARTSALLGWGGLESPRVDTFVSVANLAACVAYLWIAVRPVYGVQGVRRLVQTAALALSVALLVLGYRFLIFVITLYST